MSGYVYRVFDAADRLLYVGVSIDPDARLAQHAKNALWWCFQARSTVEQYATRDLAEMAEAEAIANEHPRWNAQGRTVRAEGIDYDRDVAGRLRTLQSEEAVLLRKLRVVRMGLAGARAEAAMIRDGFQFDEEAVA